MSESLFSATRGARNRGYSALEALVAIAVAGVILGGALPNLSASLNAHQLQSALRSTVGHLRVVRAAAIAKNAQTRLAVSEEGRTLSTEMSRDGGATWTATGQPVYLGSAVRVSAVSPGTLVFTSRGTTNATTTVTLETSRGSTKTITVSLLGSVS